MTIFLVVCFVLTIINDNSFYSVINDHFLRVVYIFIIDNFLKQLFLKKQLYKKQLLKSIVSKNDRYSFSKSSK